MKFNVELKKYLNMLNTNPKTLSRASGLSPTIISRYLNDKRMPRVQSEYFEKLVDGIYTISVEKNISISKSEIASVLQKSIESNEIDYDNFIRNFNFLLNELKINISDLAKTIGYDASFISRIKNRDRRPADLENFIDKLSSYIIENYNKQEISTIISLPKGPISNDKYKNLIVKWLSFPNEKNNQIVESFLTKLDKFNLNDYIGTDFSKVKVPTSPVILRTSKIFYNLKGRKQAEADFLKTTLLSKSKEPIFLFSDLPIEDAGKDEEFKKKWVLAITMVLKKGLHLNIIHDVDRPIKEMILGLENWIPIYMTGSISPYYFNEHPSTMFSSSIYTSGSVALSGESFKNNSKFYLTTKKEELEYYKEKSRYLLSKAKPLMTIYKEEDKESFDEFIKNEVKQPEVKKIKKYIFSNIDFYVKKNDWVIVNKLTSPEIHFVIHHSKLRDSIEQFLN